MHLHSSSKTGGSSAESGRSLTRPGTLLRQQIPIRGSLWEEGKAGWLEVDTVALCGGSVAGEFVWMVDGVDYATTWVELRAMWGRGQAGTLAALQDMEESLPFSLLGLDSDNGGEFLNHHDSAEEPLWSKSDSEKDHLRCIPRQFKSRTDEASA